MDDTTGRRRVSTAHVLSTALFLMSAGTVSLLAMQAVRGDWFPPEVSISQYGVGEYGWMLTMTLLLLAVASALLLWGADRQSAARDWRVILPWAVWTVVLVVMAFVPTNEWPAPLTTTGKIHQGAAIFGLFFAPIGAVFMAGLGRRDAPNTVAARARATAIACAGLSWFFLGLLLLTNIDVDITGLGYQRAWSLHQTLAVVLDIVMVFALIVCLRAREDVAGSRVGSAKSAVASGPSLRSASR